MLDLLLTFQFNSRLESFIAKFKTCDLAMSKHKGGWCGWLWCCLLVVMVVVVLFISGDGGCGVVY